MGKGEEREGRREGGGGRGEEGKGEEGEGRRGRGRRERGGEGVRGQVPTSTSEHSYVLLVDVRQEDAFLPILRLVQRILPVLRLHQAVEQRTLVHGSKIWHCSEAPLSRPRNEQATVHSTISLPLFLLPTPPPTHTHTHSLLLDKVHVGSNV